MLVRKGVDEERNLYRFVRQRLLSTILPLGAGGDDFGKEADSFKAVMKTAFVNAYRFE